MFHRYALITCFSLLLGACKGPGANNTPTENAVNVPEAAASTPFIEATVVPIHHSETETSPTPPPNETETEDLSCPTLPAGNLSSAPTPEVDLWKWGAKAAVSFTLDEGFREPYTILMPELDVRGWKASFFIYTDQPFVQKAWDVIIQAHRRGHEVSNHTKTHPDLTKISNEQIHAEMQGGVDELRRQLGEPEMDFPSFAYPYEATDGRTWSVVKQYHRYARSGDHGVPVPPNPVPINDARTPDFSALTAKAVTNEYTLADWDSWTDATVKSGGWFIEELHGVEHEGSVGGWEPRALSEFREHFDHIQSYGSQIWVDTMGNVGRYIEERESASVELKAWSKAGVRLLLKDGFDDEKRFNQPLSIKIALPEGLKANQVQAVQNGQSLEVRAAENGFIRVAAVPNPAKAICILPQND